MVANAQTRAHKEWINLLQPVGLVVAPPALVKAQAVPSKNVIEPQKKFVSLLSKKDGEPILSNLLGLLTEVLGWEEGDLVGRDDASELPDTLTVSLPEYEEVLSPSYAVPDPDHEGKWLMLIKVVDTGQDLDDPGPYTHKGWHASPQIRFERLLRDTEINTGLLCNGTAVRLVYAPAGESSGHVTFPVKAMSEVPGRDILAALRMLLEADRLFTMATDRRLPAILADSRKYQSEVSTELSEQVLRALGELLRGFQAADEATQGQLLSDVVREDPQRVYGGLSTVLLRLVFLLYAEERGLLPNDPVYVEHYSVSGLFEKLRHDAGLYPDTMDQRYGAWARLISLFRLVFDGASHGSMHLPTRHGQLFHPDEYPFLEGRPHRSVRQLDERLKPPRISDGVVFRVLEDLLMLDGERLSYRTLDVEQIGSVYEAIMGFEVERAKGPSIAVRPTHVVVNLKEILDAKPGTRAKLLKSEAGCDLPTSGGKELKAATTVDEVVSALGHRISPQTRDPQGNPIVLATGSLYLQPTEERRRQGAHYTPRSLTEPIVRTTLRPILGDLGERPTPEQILDLKVCDPAMGSGAFLVETCRHLADKLVDAWNLHDQMPELPPDEDSILHARRLVAQRCLYGVDKNPFAVNLAKLSLWLVTLARDHAFTFLDHALKHGDSLVGLTRKQIAAFHWDEAADQDLPIFQLIAKNVGKARSARADIFALGDENEAAKRVHHREAEEALEEARLTGDLVISAFFSSDKDKAREARRQELWKKVQDWRQGKAYENELRGVVEEMRHGGHAVEPFHWEIEFPEVFDRDSTGFDAIVGNPPFMSGTRVSTALGMTYFQWLRQITDEAGHLCDLVGYFLRRTFSLLCSGGMVGIIGTNTIAQGDTRKGGLGWICRHGGIITSATRRLRWPGNAHVVVSVVHVRKCDDGVIPTRIELDGHAVATITAYLVDRGTSDEPATLSEIDSDRYSLGCKIYGQGFLFQDNDPGASPLADREVLLKAHPEYASRILPYIGGFEVNNSPALEASRYAINVSEIETEEALRQQYPELADILAQRVRPEREKLGSNPNNVPLKRRWWAYQAHRPSLYRRIEEVERVIVVARVSQTFAFALLPPKMVFSEQLVVFALPSTAFTLLQSRVHETWARFFSSSMKDDLRYAYSDCFATFPFPRNWEGSAALAEAGAPYYATRSSIMIENQEGLTSTYNRFHNPEGTSSEILALRQLHDEMDRAVLDAYGWDDLKPTCEFLLDYEDDDEDGSSRRKKPWRYRWPDEVQEEVLARLLDLNQKRAEEERQAGLGAEKSGKKKAKKRGPPGKKKPQKGKSKAVGATQAHLTLQEDQ